MESEERKETKGREGKIYVVQVSSEHGDILRQINDTLTKDTSLIEQSDFVLIANQKNQSKKPFLE